MVAMKPLSFCAMKRQLVIATMVWICVLGLVAPVHGKTDDINKLIHQLTNNKEAVRQKAADALVRVGPPAIEALIAALGTPYTNRGPGGVLTNGQGQAYAIFPGDSTPDVREEAAAVLVRIGTPAVEPLIAALNSNNWYVRQYAADALGDIKDPRAFEPC